MKTRIILALGSILLGGTATAASVAFNVNPLVPSASKTPPQITVQQAEPEQTPETVNAPAPAEAPATEPQNGSNEVATSPTPNPTPQAPKTCRAYDGNYQTTQCDATPRNEVAPTPTPEPTPVLTDEERQNTTVSNPNH